jgi:hypothetical protein
MPDHIAARLSARAVAPTVTPARAEGEVTLGLDEVHIEGTHDEIRTLLTGALALIASDARTALDAAAPDGRDDDYTAEALDRDTARAERLTWAPGDVTITPPARES